MHNTIVCNNYGCRDVHLQGRNFPLNCFYLLARPVFPFKLASGLNLICIRVYRRGVCRSTNKLIVALWLVSYLILAIPFKFNILWHVYEKITNAQNNNTITTLATRRCRSAAAAAAAMAICARLGIDRCRPTSATATYTTGKPCCQRRSTAAAAACIINLFSGNIT